MGKQGDDHETLVSEVKRLQRQSAKFKEAWSDHCETSLGGMRDPNRHEAEVLSGFLEWWKSEGNDDSDMQGKQGADQTLVDEVKRLQRQSIKFKEAWSDHCESALGGIRDPNRHGVDVLSDFLDWWRSEGNDDSGAQDKRASGGKKKASEGKKGGPQQTVVDEVKRLQRQSAKFKEAWSDHCESALGGIRDPNRHGADVLSDFLDWWKSESGDGDGDGDSAGPPSELVEQVKRIQRSGTEGKQAWKDYCEELGGMNDPKRHSAGELQAFLEAWQEGKEPEDPAEEAPAELVQRVKELQRSGLKGKQAWAWYCNSDLDGVHDPSRHHAVKLQKFLDWWDSEAAEAEGGPVARAASPAKPADFVKQGARLSKAFSAAWSQYCKQWGRGFTDPAKYDDAYLSVFAEYAAHLISADIAGSGGEKSEALVAATAARGKRPAAQTAIAEQPPAKKILTVKKSITDEVRRINAECSLSTPIRLGAVAVCLSKLEESAALQVLASLLEEGDGEDPNLFIRQRAELLESGGAEQ